MRGEAKRKLGRTPKRVTGGYMYAEYNRMKNAHERLVEALKGRIDKACALDCQPEDVIDPDNRNSFHTVGCHDARAVLAEMGEK